MMHKYSDKQRNGEERGEEWRGGKIRWGKYLYFCSLAEAVYTRRVAVEGCFPPNEMCIAIRNVMLLHQSTRLQN